MTDKIENGDYVVCSDAADLVSVEYIDEVLQMAKMLLVTQRGKFYPNKDFGSYLKGDLPFPSDEYALAYARLALERLDGVEVSRARVENNILYVDLTINSKEKQVIQNLEDYI